MRIGCDIDDVLCDLVLEFVNFYNEKFNTNIKYEDFNSYAWYEVLNYKKEDFYHIIKEFLDLNVYFKLKPINEMIDLIKELSIENEIYLITARPDLYHNDTINWLNKFLENSYTKLIYSNNNHNFSNNNLTKGEICKELGIEIMFEDANQYAISCFENGIKTFLIDKPWNQDLEENDNLIRIKQINEIRKYLVSFNLIK